MYHIWKPKQYQYPIPPYPALGEYTDIPQQTGEATPTTLSQAELQNLQALLERVQNTCKFYLYIYLQQRWNIALCQFVCLSIISCECCL